MKKPPLCNTPFWHSSLKSLRIPIAPNCLCCSNWPLGRSVRALEGNHNVGTDSKWGWLQRINPGRITETCPQRCCHVAKVDGMDEAMWYYPIHCMILHWVRSMNQSKKKQQLRGTDSGAERTASRKKQWLKKPLWTLSIFGGGKFYQVIANLWWSHKANRGGLTLPTSA